MSVIGIVLAAALSGPAQVEPVLWMNPRGSLLVQGKETSARLTTGAKTVRTPFGLGLDLNGTHGGLLVADLPPLALSRSLTVSTWIYLRSYVNDGPGAQVLFRGDDRISLDPYSLSVLADGTIDFSIGSEDGYGASVGTDIPLQRWVHITGSFDAGRGELRIWKDGQLMSVRLTNRRSFTILEGGYAPGIGIGNVQNDHGPHNQPLNGILADLRLYDSVVEPPAVGFRPKAGQQLNAPK